MRRRFCWRLLQGDSGIVQTLTSFIGRIDRALVIICTSDARAASIRETSYKRAGTKYRRYPTQKLTPSPRFMNSTFNSSSSVFSETSNICAQLPSANTCVLWFSLQRGLVLMHEHSAHSTKKASVGRLAIRLGNCMDVIGAHGNHFDHTDVHTQPERKAL